MSILDYVYHQTPFSSTVTELYQKIVDSLKDYLKQQHEDSSVYLQLLERLNDARHIAHNLRKRLSHYRHTSGLTNSMNTLLDLVYVYNFIRIKELKQISMKIIIHFRLECKPISTDLQTNEENSTLPFIQYDL